MITPSEAIELQRRLRSNIIEEWDGRDINLIAAADVHFPSKKTARTALVTVTYPGLELAETVVSDSGIEFPYIPGLLSFREIPPILRAWKDLKGDPDLLMCDSHGIAHPRGFGMASHIGLILDIPTIGCAKSHLYGEFDQPTEQKGKSSQIRDRSGRIIGLSLRTRSCVRPVFVSIGHRIDLPTSKRIVLGCSPRYRIPVPLRLAHHTASLR